MTDVIMSLRHHCSVCKHGIRVDYNNKEVLYVWQWFQSSLELLHQLIILKSGSSICAYRPIRKRKTA